MTKEELEKTVTELKDRMDIQDCLATYSRAVDRLDRALLLSVYHPDAIDDHGVFVGGPEAFADWVIDMQSKAFLTHQHCQFNSVVDLDGDVAHVETYYMFVALNRTGKPLSMSGGRYIDRFEKRGGRWAIADRICVRDWAPLDEIPGVIDQSTLTAVKGLTEAIKTLMRTGAQISRDRNDPSYRRPLKVDRSRLTAD